MNHLIINYFKKINFSILQNFNLYFFRPLFFLNSFEQYLNLPNYFEFIFISNVANLYFRTTKEKHHLLLPL